MPDFQLDVNRYRLYFQAETAIQFPAYAGSTWRGAFGNTLRRTTCVTRASQCQGCLLSSSCAYSYIFETPNTINGLLDKVQTAPHPYILHPNMCNGQSYQAEEIFHVELTLVGKAIQQLPYLIHAFQQIGSQGLGKQKGQSRLIRVEQSKPAIQHWQTIYTPEQSLQAHPASPLITPALPEHVTIHFNTPYRAMTQGKLVNAQRFNFQNFINTLIRRISLLHTYHADIELDADFKTLSQQAQTINLLDSQLHWYDWDRYSNRQQNKVQMGGLLGHFSLPAAQLEPYWEWLWLGQWLNTGKGAVMGMGEYRINPDN